jgi:hypothetical protein
MTPAHVLSESKVLIRFLDQPSAATKFNARPIRKSGDQLNHQR